MSTYSISVENQSGGPHTYSFFTEEPKISGGSQVFTNVCTTAFTPPNATSSARFSKEYFAVLGTYSGRPSEGVMVNVSQSAPVTLGRSTIPMVAKWGTPQFGGPAGNGSDPGAFSITTGNDFTQSDAENDNWQIGLGIVSGRAPGPCATFVPQPGVTYKIQPTTKFYVTFGEFRAGQIIDVPRLGNRKCLVDFSSGGKDSYTVVHGPDGRLTVQG